jgi:predicted nucleic acid-binding protein
MADYYADSSVLVKRHVNEIGSYWFRALADPATGKVIITSRVSIIEVYSAFNRRVRRYSNERKLGTIESAGFFERN